MIAAHGIVTATGGSTSHAAVVARALGTSCVVGASAITGRRGRPHPGRRRPHARARATRSPSTAPAASCSSAGFTHRDARVAATAALGALLGLAAGASGCEVLSRVTLPADVAAAVQAGASGLVTAVDDVLAATGHLDGLVQNLLGDGATGGVDRIADLVAQEFTPLLRAAGDGEVGVRAIDLVADEARELLQQTAVTTRHPELSVPLGRPALIEAQLAGLARALEDSGGRAAVHLAVRHVSDPAEARALRVLGEGTGIGVGAYLTSPRGALAAGAVAEAGDVLWLEVRAVQAAVFGLPARQLLTAEPLDGYLAQGMLSCDPRTTIDPSVEVLLAGVADAAAAVPRCRVGLRLSGEVSQEAAAQLHTMGFRRFAVDAAETRPLVLALGRAALGV
jgi:pyruvate,orthophosphate dikinase